MTTETMSKTIQEFSTTIANLKEPDVEVQIAALQQLETLLKDTSSTESDESKNLLAISLMLIPEIPKILEFAGASKQKKLSEAAESLIMSFVEVFPTANPNPNPDISKEDQDSDSLYSGCYILRQSLAGLSQKSKPATKDLTLRLIEQIATRCKEYVSTEIANLIQPVVYFTSDPSPSLRNQAKATLCALILACGNKDILGNSNGNSPSSFVTAVVNSCGGSKDKIKSGVETLASCVFVQNVEAPHLAVLTNTVLRRGLSLSGANTDDIVGMCCAIVRNMCEVIDDPREGVPLFTSSKDSSDKNTSPSIYTLVKKRCDDLSNPNTREIAECTLTGWCSVCEILIFETHPESMLLEPFPC